MDPVGVAGGFHGAVWDLVRESWWGRTCGAAAVGAGRYGACGSPWHQLSIPSPLERSFCRPAGLLGGWTVEPTEPKEQLMRQWSKNKQRTRVWSGPLLVRCSWCTPLATGLRSAQVVHSRASFCRLRDCGVCWVEVKGWTIVPCGVLLFPRPCLAMRVCALLNRATLLACRSSSLLLRGRMLWCPLGLGCLGRCKRWLTLRQLLCQGTRLLSG